MANPISFPSTTTHFSLPLLFAGQAQKEPFINHAISALDALLGRTVEASLASPPSAPADGARYRITAGASGDWTGREDDLAVWIGGAWEFFSPVDGMQVFDRSEQILYFFSDSWAVAAEPAAPTGGATVDTEARAAIAILTEALRTAGIFEKSA